jgi:hypothetical protein
MSPASTTFRTSTQASAAPSRKTSCGFWGLPVSGSRFDDCRQLLRQNPLPYVYEPDLTRPGHDDGHIPNASLRLTWQATSKDKISGWITDQHKERDHFALITGIVPDALALQKTPMARGTVIKWARTQTSRLMLEAGVGDVHNLYIENYRPEVTPTTYSITDQANGKCFNAYCPGQRAPRQHAGLQRHSHLRDRLSRIQERHAPAEGVSNVRTRSPAI